MSTTTTAPQRVTGTLEGFLKRDNYHDHVSCTLIPLDNFTIILFASMLKIQLFRIFLPFLSCPNSSASVEKTACVMVFNATFNNISVISWRYVLLVEETGVSKENNRHVASH